ncbi:MAG: tRNA (adenosine(37)-N6)-threonylcarbamoyltransferase complex dimerization subunit type 1 TsaB [Sphingomonadales bacterium]|nr:tRNA (adenosine(37)-N6)-threonylcarbamoyltransferase complex dimerization subunit type 1 TsaB [Sphingomonadales bacterium]
MRSERWILGFDTSAAHCAAALLRDGAEVETRIDEMARGQAEHLMPMLEDMLARAGIGWRDLCSIGVGIGPGNFTGVRISVAAARGLALSLGIPAIGVSTLEARALNAPRPVTVIEDARRGEVYWQSFTDQGPGAPRLDPVDALPPPGGSLILGTGAPAAAGAPAGDARGLAPAHPLPRAIARIADLRAATPQPRPAPLYLRGADAAPPADPPPVILD